MNTKPYIILGEAQESDSEEEIDYSDVSTGQIEQCKGRIVTGEAPESDEEMKGERNTSLHKNINDFISQTTMNAGTELNVTNQRLLKCQVQLQDGAEHIKKLNSNLSFLDYNLQTLLGISYLPKINICDYVKVVENKLS
ncbi:hypothetical protein RUM44_000390 [Polyplax serrata]|uniref:Biogenesis of lysosome-related organelles complex 1 subunit 3 n=1 Tax=Polyplax serrata TaxID=468196 RepID=A0ABR1B6J9_POLSC